MSQGATSIEICLAIDLPSRFRLGDLDDRRMEEVGQSLRDTPQRPSILLVDDYEPNLTALEAVLEPVGAALVKATSGEEALRRILEHEFALLIIDLRMPGMDGIETATIVRSRNRDLPIILLTAHELEDKDIRRGYACGGVDVLRKPILPETIRAKASVFVQLFEQRSRIQSQRAALEVRHRHSEDLLRLIVEQSGDGIIVSDANGVLTFFNQAAERQYGARQQEVMRADWAEKHGPFRRDGSLMQRSETPLARALAGEVVHEAEWMIRRPDGAERILVGTAAPLRYVDGSPAGAVLTTRDVTERRQAEERLARSNRDLDQFAYVASHDLKAPLRGIANLSQWLEEDLGPLVTGDSKRQLALLRNRVQRMEALIDGILAYSRAGRGRAEKEEVAVGALVEEVVDLLHLRDAASIEIQSGMPAVTCERVGLQQIFLNLLGNAVKHAKGAKPNVRVGFQDSARFHEFFVADDGPGIAPEYHEKIWGLFQMLERRDEVEGTGIGLAIVKKTVEVAGGRAWVESVPGEGATFRFTWPKDQGGSAIV
jgi:PAS domain S-box-containing protein